MDIKKIAEQIKQQQLALTTQQKSTTIERKPLFDPEGFRVEFLKRLDYRIHKNTNGERRLSVNDENSRVIELVCMYANNEQGFVDAGYNHDKGLLLGGRTGSGKTELLRTYKDFVKIELEKPIAFHACQDVYDKFVDIDPDTMKMRGYYGIKDYCAINSPTEKIFDDLGIEETMVQDYGNKTALMPYVFGKRHDNKFTCGKTHATTNLSKKSLIDKYGSRFESRLNETFNFIGLGTDENSIDYRKI